MDVGALVELVMRVVLGVGNPYGEGVHSVRFVHDTVVRGAPHADAELIGVVRHDTHALPIDVAPSGDGCARRWLAIAPRGWVCETAIEPSPALPTAPRDDGDGDAATGVYGLVRREARAFASADDAEAGTGRALVGANSVRAIGRVAIGDRHYWRTSQGELIDEAAIVQVAPSKFRGVELAGDDALPAWIHPRREPYTAAATYAAPDGPRTGTIPARWVVTVHEQSADGKFARIGEDTWVARADLRVAQRAAPPSDAGDDKWLDVDLDEQVLVAYEGERPVFATLVSTGRAGHATPAGIARIASKHERADMTNTKAEAYSVADVPWTMYYDRDFALHTSYWHDGFGSVRSHGCVNLAPRDARWLYQWSSPDVPPGWVTVYGTAEHPGSLVRVHSKQTPDPPSRETRVARRGGNGTRAAHAHERTAQVRGARRSATPGS